MSAMDNFIEKAIPQAVMGAVGAAVNVAVAQAQAAVEKDIRGRVGQIAAEVSRHISYERRGDDVVITVRFPPTS